MIEKLFDTAAQPGRATFAVPNSGRHDTQLARWDTHRAKSSVTIVTARGEIDGSNAKALTKYLLAEMPQCRSLILDISRLEFFGAAGFSTLKATADSCTEAGIRWALVPNATVARVLDICDPKGSLPAADTVDAALILIRHLVPMPHIGNRDKVSV
ncbi:anti-sigma factor antagonist [Mycobacterium camsae]|uniref:anti-sigma factor antagonist n=1 Tax=Mycobacterium gordonae TaxID=1778 RepID=UPI00197DC4CC|nr:anti-sigma factor antagonist [Mycobacterium gordonae]